MGDWLETCVQAIIVSVSAMLVVAAISVATFVVIGVVRFAMWIF